MPRLDFDAINAAALARYRSLLESWFPNGKVEGHEFKVGNLAGEPGRSLSINLNTGVWADFADQGVGGSDPISLYAAKFCGNDQGRAARELADLLGMGDSATLAHERTEPKPAPAKQGGKMAWAPILPVPENAPAPRFRHPAHGDPAAVWTYRDAEGRVLGYVCRFNLPDGSKEILPLSFCANPKRERRWRWLSFPKPRPLYGLDRLAAAPGANVVVVEGEKCADAAAVLFPHAVVVTWPGGGKAVRLADWAALQGRKVVIWPDWDRQPKHKGTTELKAPLEQPGMVAALWIAEALHGIAAAVRILLPPEDKPDGWDAADAIADGWTAESAADYLRANLYDVDGVRAKLGGAEPEPEEPPPPEPGDDMPEDFDGMNAGDGPPPGDDRPFQCLGYDHGTFYYMPRGSKQVVDLSGAAHTARNLLMLAPMRYWAREFPGRQGPSWDMAANALMRWCERVGVFDPGRIRGRGAWWDDGGAVLHLGDRVIAGGRVYALGELESRYIYEAAAPIRVNIDDPLPAKQAVELAELCRLLPWEKPINALLLAGWCAIAPVCGALQWRPHIWLTGPAGAGKSWVFEHILRRCLGDSALAVQSETTEAGLRQTLGHDARPVVFDEAEGEDARAQARIQNVMALMRQASSEGGAAILKGSATGTSVAYRIRSCFAFASIGVGVAQHADQTRVTVLGLTVNNRQTKEQRLEQFQRLQEKWLATLTPEFVERLQARIIRLIAVIRRNAETFAVAGAKVIGTRRVGDQIGALLAGAYALHSDKAITLEDAVDWVNRQDWADESAIQDARDELVCLQHILEHRVRVQTERGTYERNLGELCAVASMAKNDELYPDVARDTLKRYGLKVEGDRLLVSTTHTALQKLLRDTPWHRNWGRILKRIDGAETTDATRFGAGVTTRATAVPLAVAIGDEPDDGRLF